MERKTLHVRNAKRRVEPHFRAHRAGYSLMFRRRKSFFGGNFSAGSVKICAPAGTVRLSPALEHMLAPVDDVVLQRARKLNEHRRVTGNAYDEVAMLLGMLLRIDKRCTVNHIELNVLNSQARESAQVGGELLQSELPASEDGENLTLSRLPLESSTFWSLLTLLRLAVGPC